MRRIPLPNSSAAEDPTMFDERAPREYRAWALPLFFLVSLMAHALGFYAFHVVYPTPRDVPQPNATLSLVTLPEPGAGASAEADQRLLAEWLRENDPALLTTWKSIPPDWSKLERGKYAPLHERWKFQPELAAPGTPYTQEAEALSQAVRTESWDWRLGQTPAPMDMAWLGVEPLPPEPPPAPAETLITLSPLAASDTDTSPPRRINPPRPAAPDAPAFRIVGELPLASVQNAEFLVGADSATGRVLFTLTRRGSNSEELDTAAETYLRKLRLTSDAAEPTADNTPAPPQGPLTWWQARFAWGKEVFPP